MSGKLRFIAVVVALLIGALYVWAALAELGVIR